MNILVSRICEPLEISKNYFPANRFLKNPAIESMKFTGTPAFRLVSATTGAAIVALPSAAGVGAGVAMVAEDVGGTVVRLLVGVTGGLVRSVKTENVVCTLGVEAVT